MLYNEKWTKADPLANPLSLESLIAWLETKRASERYDFFCVRECMVGQWAVSIDPCATAASELGWGAHFYVVNGDVVDLGEFVLIANSDDGSFTFGAALNRARKTLAQGAV